MCFHSDPELLARAVDALADQTVPVAAVRVLVNDDPHGRDTAAIRDRLGEAVPIVLEQSAENLGFAGGHNRLLAAGFAAGAELAIVHNPDLALERTAVAALAEAAAQGVLAGPVLELADPRTLVGEGVLDTRGIRWTWDGRHLDAGQGEPLPTGTARAPFAVAGVSGACLAVPRTAFERIVAASGEFFDEDFVAYREDAELAFRAELLGVRSVVAPAARGRHARSLRGTARGADPWVDRLGVRNRFLIAFKYGRRRPGLLLGPWLRDLVVIAGVLLRERTSLPGLREAWALRVRMRAKGRRVLAAAGAR